MPSGEMELSTHERHSIARIARPEAVTGSREDGLSTRLCAPIGVIWMRSTPSAGVASPPGLGATYPIGIEPLRIAKSLDSK